MSRFSPTVLPQGPTHDPVDEIMRALMMRRQNRRQDVADAREGERHEWDRTDQVEEGVDRTRRRTSEDVNAGRQAELFDRTKDLWGREDETYGRSTARENAQDHDAGIRMGTPPGLGADPARQRTRAALGALQGNPVTGQIVAAPARQILSTMDQQDRAAASNYVELGAGRYLDTSATPEARTRARTDAERRAAFDRLHSADPKLYAEYAPGYDYVSEMGDTFDDTRAGRRQAADFSHDFAIEGMRQAAQDRRARMSASNTVPDPPITLNQALSQVREMAEQRDPKTGFVTGYGLSEAEMVQRAHALVRGEIPPAPPPRPGPPAPTITPMRATPPQRGGRGTGQPRAAAPAQLSPGAVAEARGLVQGLSTSEAIQELQGVGYSPREVNQILSRETRLDRR